MKQDEPININKTIYYLKELLNKKQQELEQLKQVTTELSQQAKVLDLLDEVDDLKELIFDYVYIEIHNRLSTSSHYELEKVYNALEEDKY